MIGQYNDKMWFLTTDNHTHVSCHPWISSNAVTIQGKYGYLTSLSFSVECSSLKMASLRLSETQDDILLEYMNFKSIRCQIGFHYVLISRLVWKHGHLNDWKDLSQSWRSRKTSQLENMQGSASVAPSQPFATSRVLLRQWLPIRQISTRTVKSLEIGEIEGQRGNLTNPSCWSSSATTDSILFGSLES